jgi:hypothetical protein
MFSNRTWTLHTDIEHGHWTWTLEPEDDNRQHDALRRILLSRVYFLFLFYFLVFLVLDELFLLLTCWLTAALESKNVISLKVFFTLTEKDLIVFYIHKQISLHSVVFIAREWSRYLAFWLIYTWSSNFIEFR